MGPGRKKRSGPVPAWALKVASVVMTLSVFGSGLGYASTHLSTTNAPLQPAVVALVLDATARISLVDLVVPFQTSYGQLAIGLGTISLDLVVIVIVTTWLRRALSNSWWQWMHRLSYVGFVTMFLHAILSGTDLASPLIAGLSWAAAIAIGYYSLERAGRSLAVAKARA